MKELGYCRVHMPSVPRTGSTWFRAMFEAATGQPSFSMWQGAGVNADGWCGTCAGIEINGDEAERIRRVISEFRFHSFHSIPFHSVAFNFVPVTFVSLFMPFVCCKSSYNMLY